MKKLCIAITTLLLIYSPLVSQSHTAVPLGEPIYYILEQAHMRGLCGNLPEAKPYSRAFVLKYIEEILSRSGPHSLTAAERTVLEEYQRTLSPPEKGLDIKQGSYYFEHIEDSFRFTGNVGVTLDLLFSNGFYTEEKESVWSTDNWLTAFAEGDIGYNFSYGISVSGGVMRAPRSELGKYNTFYDGFQDKGNLENREITTYSEPLSYFPYSYRKNWDAFVWDYRNISNSGQLAWPQSLSIGYTAMGELAGTAFSDHLFYRFGRLEREWAGMSNGSSLTLNEAARPFVAFETTFMPFDWFAFSSMTGVLEYYKLAGLKSSSESSQNAFSIGMVELNYKNYLHMDFGSTAVWGKRFELGYIFPLFDNFFYQNNIGDFDNMAIFLNVKGQYPGIGKAWFSFFLDEINPQSDMFELDRSMYAYQFGTSVAIPWLPFTSVKLSYTKNEPYNYTHTREYLPWYGDILMETNYVNNGVSLGHYLPPNSDEILVRFETMPVTKSRAHLQYQLIRHGADYGSRAVDGSSLWSELGPDRNTDPVLRKYFLRDGAYQWMHIVKIGGEYTIAISGVPVKLFAETGVVYSYFTDIDGPVNSGSPSAYSIINTAEYPHSTAIIATLGIRIFAK